MQPDKRAGLAWADPSRTSLTNPPHREAVLRGWVNIRTLLRDVVKITRRCDEQRQLAYRALSICPVSYSVACSQLFHVKHFFMNSGS